MNQLKLVKSSADTVCMHVEHAYKYLSFLSEIMLEQTNTLTDDWSFSIFELLWIEQFLQYLLVEFNSGCLNDNKQEQTYMNK